MGGAVGIVLLLFVVPFYTWYGLRQSFANDRLIAQLEADPENLDVRAKLIQLRGDAMLVPSLKCEHAEKGSSGKRHARGCHRSAQWAPLPFF